MAAERSLIYGVPTLILVLAFYNSWRKAPGLPSTTTLLDLQPFKMAELITGSCNCGRHTYTVPKPTEMNLCRK